MNNNKRAKANRRLVTDSDRCRLGSLLTSAEGRFWGRARVLRILDARLEDAERVSNEQTPRYLVTMNSTVDLLDLASGKLRRVTLAYPEDCELIPDGISVLEPLGVELLGHRIGDTFYKGGRKIRINTIVYQPEAARAEHL